MCCRAPFAHWLFVGPIAAEHNHSLSLPCVRTGPSRIALRLCSLASSPREAIASLDHPGRPVLACSASGRSISAVWPQLRAYAIYTLAPTGAWEVVDRGARCCGQSVQSGFYCGFTMPSPLLCTTTWIWGLVVGGYGGWLVAVLSSVPTEQNNSHADDELLGACETSAVPPPPLQAPATTWCGAAWRRCTP